MTDPAIAVLDQDDPRFDAYDIRENLRLAGLDTTSRIPTRYRDAVADMPEIRQWVVDLVETVKQSGLPLPVVETGPSLLLLGITGTGKTHQCYGAVRALAASGVRCGWELVTAADAYARLRPRHRVDPEEEFDRLARVGLLVLDDLGAAKSTEWTEEVNLRLINYRYERCKPTLVTSNVPPRELGAAVGERVASRLMEMAKRVTLKGVDRRRPNLAAS